MLKRVLSAIIMSCIAFAAVWFGGYILTGGIILCIAIGCIEYVKAFRNKGMNPMVSVVVLGLAFPCLAHLKGYGLINEVSAMRFILLACTLILIADLAILVAGHKKYTVIDGAVSFLGAFYAPGLLSFFILMRSMKGASGEPFGRYYVILAVLVTAMADTFALFAGKMFGKRKLIPEVSPHKTVAGSVGAVAGAVVFSEIFGLVMNLTGVMQTLSWYDYFVIGIIVGIMSQFGDLCASSVKRYCGIKDFGKLIPGHGGILDRVDSHMYIMPLVYFYILFVTGA